MKSINKNIVLFLIMGIAWSCLPEPLPVNNIPEVAPTVVVGSQVLPEEFLVITLTRNFNALTAGPETDIDEIIEELLLDSIEVAVEVEGQVYPLYNVASGIYVGNGIPQITDAIYTLALTNPFNNRALTASTQLLANVGFEDLQVSLNQTPFDTLVNVKLRIDDPPEKNWYMVNVQLLNEEYDLQELPYIELIDDEDFETNLIDYEFTMPFRDYAPGDTVLVSMANISSLYYEFLTIRKDQRYSLLDGLGEPVNYPTNIINGQGFFHAHQPDIQLFVFSE